MKKREKKRKPDLHRRSRKPSVRFPGPEPGRLVQEREWRPPSATLWNMSHGLTRVRDQGEELVNPAMPNSSLPSSFSLM